MQVRYQAALRPEYRHYIGICAVKQSTTLYNVGYEWIPHGVLINPLIFQCFFDGLVYDANFG